MWQHRAAKEGKVLLRKSDRPCAPLFPQQYLASGVCKTEDEVVSRAKNANGGESKVGYKKPPEHSRFSSTNQPVRLGLPPLPLRRKTMAHFAQEKVAVRVGDGAAIKLTADQVIREKLIASALGGNIDDARELYRHLDREEDAAAVDPKSRRSKSQDARFERAMDLLFRKQMAERDLLAEAQVIEMIDGAWRIADWVHDAASAR